MKKPIFAIFFVCLATTLLTASCGSSDHLKDGKSYLAKGDLAAALIALKNAAQSDPQNPAVRTLLGDTLERVGDLTGSEQQYRRAVELGGDASELVPKIAMGLVDRGQMALVVRDFGTTELALPAGDSELRGILAMANLALGKVGQASAELAKATTQTPAVRLARAEFALRERRYQAAITEIEAELQDGKAPWWFWRSASRILADRGSADRALAAIKTAHEEAPWHPGLMGEYAEQLIRANKMDQAKPLREQLKKIAPRYYRTHLIDAMFYAREGRSDDVHIAATRVLEAVPDHVPAQLLAATVEFGRGELAAVEERLKKILAKNPASIEALRMRISLELRRGDRRAALAALNQALRHSPNDPGLLTTAANLAWTNGDKSGAVQQLALALDAAPMQPQLHLRMAEMKHAMGKRVEAMAAIDRAVELSGDSAHLREQVFQVLMRMRLPAKARVWVEKEIVGRPDDPEPIFWLGILLAAEGQKNKALEQTRRALDIRPDYAPALSALARRVASQDGAREYQARLLKAVEMGTRHPRVYIDLARMLSIGGADAARIGEVLERGVNAAPGEIELRQAAVRHWLAWGRADKAEALAAEGEAAQPENIALISLAALVHEVKGNFEQSGKRYRDLSVRFPNGAEWSYKLAASLTRAGKQQEAIDVLKKIVAGTADDPTAYRMLAQLQVDSGRKADALSTAAMLRDRTKLKVPGLLLQGDILAQAGDNELALNTFSEAEKGGAMEMALAHRIDLLDRSGSRSAASEQINKVIAARPGNVSVLLVAARHEHTLGNLASAANYLKEVLRLQPANVLALNELGWTYVRLGNPEALGIARKAAELAPTNAAILDTLALAYANAGRNDEAESTWRRALGIDPLAAAVRLHLAEWLLKRGRKDEIRGLVMYLDDRALSKDDQRRLTELKGQF